MNWPKLERSFSAANAAQEKQDGDQLLNGLGAGPFTWFS
jgi:hypothetical protein